MVQKFGSSSRDVEGDPAEAIVKIVVYDYNKYDPDEVGKVVAL